MKITPILQNFHIIRKKPLKAENIPAPKPPAEKCSVVERGIWDYQVRINNAKIAKKYFSQFLDFSVSDYNKISKSSLNNVRNICDTDTIAAVNNSLIQALNLKKLYDREYGKDNYAFVSIGTSPALVAKAFESMGIDTYYLPMSGLRQYDIEKNYDRLKKHSSNYVNYMKEMGLDGEKIEKSDKKFIFSDYTHSGKSLNIFEKMLRDVFDINSENIVFRSLNFDMEKAADDDKKAMQKAKLYTAHYMCDGLAAEYTNIPHFDIYDISQIDLVGSRKNHHANMFNFILIDKINELGLLNNCENI